MKVLLDEMLPAGVADLLLHHEVVTVRNAGYSGLSNGALLRAAAAAGFDVLVTADGSLPLQQNIPASSIAIVLVPGNRLAEVRVVRDELQVAVDVARPGTVARVARGPLRP